VTALLPVAWAALLLTGAWTIRPRPHPRPVLVTPRRRFLRPDVTRTLVGMVGALVVPVPFVVMGLFGAWAVPVVRRRRAAARREAAIVRSLPEVVDLFHLAVTAGLTVPLAVDAVVRRSHGPIVDELGAALDEVAIGRRLGDALHDVPARTGEVVRPLVAALVASDRYGAPLGDALGRLASEVRADRRRRAEEAARKVPVKLLFPLVSCVLPAFGLLTLAPLIAGAVAALRL
jgi:tight adherence protein C